MSSDGTFCEDLVYALAREDDDYRPAPERAPAGFWQELLVALRRETPAFTGKPQAPTL
jgi:hypothetical protein